MPEDPIESLYVSIRGDIGDLLADIKKGVDEANERLDEFGKRGEKAFRKPKEPANGLIATIEKLKVAFVALGAFIASMKVGGFFVDLAKGAVAANAKFETFRTQFQTLLGSSEAAERRLEELAQFGVETPFELAPVVEASRILQTFGGDVLATGENLRMIGDIAAGVNQPFQDVAFWIGRMYDALQSGRPWGEAGMRLQEMGALTGGARAELERLQKSGASGAEIWQRFNELVGSRFAGNMERLSKTLQGLTSTLVDFRDNLLRVGGEAVFEQVRGDAERLLEILSDKEGRAALENLARAAGEAAAAILKMVTGPALAALENIDPQAMDRLAESTRDLVAAINEFLETDFTTDLNGLIDALTVLSDTLTVQINHWNDIKAVIEPVAPIFNALRDVVLSILFPVSNLINAFSSLSDIVDQLTGKSVADFSRDVADASQTTKQASDDLKKSAENYADTLAATFGRAGEKPPETPADTMADANDKAMEKLQGSFVDLLELEEQTREESEQLATEHNQALLEIDSDYIQERLKLGEELADALEKMDRDTTERREEIIEDAQDKLNDLDKDTAKSRTQIFADAAEELAKLSQDTDQTLADEREDFEEEERRETEDHLEDMRRLREQYLFDLENAVAARDARAIVDLRRRFQQEEGQRQEDFQTQQARRGEDQDQRLAEIRENEQRRSDEIIAARERELEELRLQDEERRGEIEADRQEQLDELRENEQERRGEIKASFDEELTALDTKHNEELARENSAYALRQQQLDEAMAKRLESIAQELATEDKINEEGAAKILGTLAKYFGEEGEIDNLMREFEKRTHRVMRIKVDFEGGGEDEETGGASMVGVGAATSGRSFAAGGSMIARSPTLARFGEAGPELAQFTPLGQVGSNSLDTKRIEGDIGVHFTGVPAHIDQAAMEEAAASVVLQALREAGMRR